jgi:hypothetical protein
MGSNAAVQDAASSYLKDYAEWVRENGVELTDAWIRFRHGSSASRSVYLQGRDRGASERTLLSCDLGAVVPLLDRARSGSSTHYVLERGTPQARNYANLVSDAAGDTEGTQLRRLCLALAVMDEGWVVSKSAHDQTTHNTEAALSKVQAEASITDTAVTQRSTYWVVATGLVTCAALGLCAIAWSQRATLRGAEGAALGQAWIRVLVALSVGTVSFFTSAMVLDLVPRVVVSVTSAEVSSVALAEAASNRGVISAMETYETAMVLAGSGFHANDKLPLEINAQGLDAALAARNMSVDHRRFVVRTINISYKLAVFVDNLTSSDPAARGHLEAAYRHVTTAVAVSTRREDADAAALQRRRALADVLRECVDADGHRETGQHLDADLVHRLATTLADHRALGGDVLGEVVKQDRLWRHRAMLADTVSRATAIVRRDPRLVTAASNRHAIVTANAFTARMEDHAACAGMATAVRDLHSAVTAAQQWGEDANGPKQRVADARPWVITAVLCALVASVIGWRPATARLRDVIMRLVLLCFALWVDDFVGHSATEGGSRRFARFETALHGLMDQMDALERRAHGDRRRDKPLVDPAFTREIYVRLVHVMDMWPDVISSVAGAPAPRIRALSLVDRVLALAVVLALMWSANRGIVLP